MEISPAGWICACFPTWNPPNVMGAKKETQSLKKQRGKKGQQVLVALQFNRTATKAQTQNMATQTASHICPRWGSDWFYLTLQTRGDTQISLSEKKPHSPLALIQSKWVITMSKAVRYWGDPFQLCLRTQTERERERECRFCFLS